MDSVLAEATSYYENSNPESLRLHREASANLPGGNTRSVLYNKPFPLFLKRGFFSKVEDADGHVYTDMVGEMTAGLYGHSNPTIRAAIVSAFDEMGVSLGGNNTYENLFAREIRKRFPAIEKLRYCNSGSEANINLMVVAKAFTGKKKIVVFYGGYHGGPLSFGHGNASTNIEADNFILAEYNDIASFERALASSDDIAAVLVEGMQGAGGAIPGKPGFLRAIQEKCRATGVLFILDEVMTSRLSSGGLQKVYGLHPDLVSLGKYLGGGLTFGAFGGRADILDLFDPAAPHAIPHSGTFNNNTLTLAAGYAGLTEIYTPEKAEELNARGDKLRENIASACQGTKMSCTGVGSVMNIHFTASGTYESAHDADQAVAELHELFWLDMLRAGYWVAYRGMVSLMAVLTEEEIAGFEAAVLAWIRDHSSLIAL